MFPVVLPRKLTATVNFDDYDGFEVPDFDHLHRLPVCVCNEIGDFIVETYLASLQLDVSYWDGAERSQCRTRLPHTTSTLRKARERHERLVGLLDEVIVVPKGTPQVGRHRWFLKTGRHVVFRPCHLPASVAALWKLRYN